MSSFSSDKYPELELLDHMIALFFNFLRKFSAVFHSGFMYIGSLWATQQQRLQIAITTGTLFRALPSSAPQQRPFHYRGFNSLLSVLPVRGSAVVYGLEVQKTIFLGCTLHTIRMASAGCIVSPSGRKCFHKS